MLRMSPIPAPSLHLIPTLNQTMFSQSQISGTPTSPKCHINIAGHSVSVMIDSGTSVNILDDATFNEITCNKGIRLERTNHKIYSYGSLRPLPLKGVIKTNISWF
jgi:hypothetical protein